MTERPIAHHGPYGTARCEICKHSEYGGTCSLTSKPVNVSEAPKWPVVDYYDYCEQFSLEPSAVAAIEASVKRNAERAS